MGKIPEILNGYQILVPIGDLDIGKACQHGDKIPKIMHAHVKGAKKPLQGKNKLQYKEKDIWLN